jgi:hypothetical protein
VAGIKRLVELALDRLSARRTERQIQSALKKGTDPKAARRNLKKVESSFSSLRKNALLLGGIFAGVFSAAAIGRFFRNAIGAAKEADEIWNRLGGTLATVGIQFEDVQEEINRTARALQDTSTVGDEEFAATLQKLVQISGDYEQSLKNVALVADVSAGAQIDMKTAADLVGRAMVGQTGTLSRYGIVVGEGVDAIELMRDSFRGLAQNETRSLSGQLKQLSNEWGDLLQAVGEVFTEAAVGSGIIRTLTDVLKGLAIWVDRNSESFTLFLRPLNAAVRGIQAMGANAAVTAGALKVLFLQMQSAVALGLSPAIEQQLESAKRELEFLREARDEIIAALQAGDAVVADIERRTLGTRQPSVPGAGTGAAGAGAAAKEEAEKLVIPEPDIVRLHEITGSVQEFTQIAGTGLLQIRGGMMDIVQTADVMSGAWKRAQENFAANAELIRQDLQGVQQFAMTAAFVAINAWEDAFSLWMRGLSDVGDLAKGIFKGLAEGALAALADMARGKVAENIAWAIQRTAQGIAAAVNPFTAPQAAGFFASAAKHVAAAAAWGVLAGFSGAASGAVGGGRGGAGGGVGGGAGATRDPLEVRQPPVEWHIHLDPLSPEDPRFQRVAQVANDMARERGVTRQIVNVNGVRVGGGSGA